ncbi:MAG: transcription elongation factor GreA [Candidatus Parcubacteria bacterium]|jgi:transcription elongation factor GreA
MKLRPKEKKIHFTRDGLEKIQKEHDLLVHQRKDAVTNLSIARAMGDLSENAAYTAARRKLSTMDGQIRRLAQVIRNAEIVEVNFKGFVELGCSVTISDGKTERTFMIVGGYESDIVNNKLSQFSPIGKAVMGKKKGEQVIVLAPAGVIKYTITDVKG